MFQGKTATVLYISVYMTVVAAEWERHSRPQKVKVFIHFFYICLLGFKTFAENRRESQRDLSTCRWILTWFMKWVLVRLTLHSWNWDTVSAAGILLAGFPVLLSNGHCCILVNVCSISLTASLSGAVRVFPHFLWFLIISAKRCYCDGPPTHYMYRTSSVIGTLVRLHNTTRARFPCDENKFQGVLFLMYLQIFRGWHTIMWG